MFRAAGAYEDLARLVRSLDSGIWSVACVVGSALTGLVSQVKLVSLFPAVSAKVMPVRQCRPGVARAAQVQHIQAAIA